MHHTTRKIGSEKERLAGEYLKKQGFQVVEYNFTAKSGEIDIVAKEGEYLVFVEVKYRSSYRNGMPEETIHTHKIKRITNTAQYYMLRRGIPEDTPCRFDAVVILGQEIKLIRDAFEAI